LLIFAKISSLSKVSEMLANLLKVPNTGKSKKRKILVLFLKVLVFYRLFFSFFTT